MSARSVRPRQQLHRGTVVAAAFWFNPALLGVREAQARVLAAWAPGTSVFPVAGGLLLRLPQPRPVNCSATPGLPLTLEEGVLFSAPLSAAEREQLSAAPGSTVLVRAGRAESFRTEPSQRLEVAAWLDVSGWTTADVQGLGAPPPPVKVLEPVEAPARHLFKGVPAADPEAEAMRARMEGRPEPQGLLAAKVSEKERAPSAMRRLMSWLQRALRFGEATGDGKRALPSGTPVKAQAQPERLAEPSWLARMLARLRQSLFSSGADTSSRPALPEPATPPPPRGPPLLSRLSEWLLRNTPLGPLLGRRKAEYVQRLFDMFEQGDLHEALRYAIPLGADRMTEQARIALGLPGPRESLAIQPQRGGAASLFGGGQEVYAALKQRYRAAFARLEREGKIDEAAFVLTELLGAHEEAVSFLEKHGRLRLAAELAEGRGLAPGLVVRQWLLAKDLQRAVAIARRSGAFADAVLRLERTHPDQARTLRVLWAEALAESGSYLRAATVVWPLEDARPLARAWLEHGITVGGVGGARALARLISDFPGTFAESWPAVLELMEDESQARAVERLAFAEVLVSQPTSDVRSALVGPTVRALMRDRAAGHARIESNFLARLLRDTGDGTLRADMPAVPELRRRKWLEEPEGALLTEHIAAAEAGPFPIHDAVALSGQRLLLALGEGGVRMLRADGTCSAHFDVPAFALVPSVNEDRVLALAPRGELKRLSLIEPGPRRATYWCDAKVDAFAPSCDGNLWFIAEEDTVMAVDMLSLGGFRALWRVSQVGGKVMALEVDADSLRFATWGGEPQLWAYSLAGGPTLRSRSARSLGDGLPLVMEDEATHEPRVLDDVVQSPPWVLMRRRTAMGQELKLATRGRPPRAELSFGGPAHVKARFWGEELLLFDTAGRLVRVDLTEGRLRRIFVQ